MSIQQTLLPILRCQRCYGNLSFSVTRPPDPAAAEFGVLVCRCSKYPVVDGIPILQRGAVGMFDHTTGTAQVAGVTPARLVELIEQGNSGAALFEAIGFPMLPPLLRRLLGWRLSTSAPATRFGRWLCKRRMEAEILSRRGSISAMEVVGFFYQLNSPLDIAVGDYFNRRFAQPRHLAALSLLQNVSTEGKPLLDIACGCGHFDHYLTARRDAVAVVGTDLNFFHLWIARHWIAPSCQYVCADASEGLPFADDSFSASFCSDAYHLIGERKKLHQEIARCAPGRPGILSRVGNARVMPNEGQENAVSGYLDEIGAQDTRVFTEGSLVRLYLKRLNPLAEPGDGSEELEWSKWLSFAWNLPAQLRDPSKEEWPHAVGRLGLNPIYTRRAAVNEQIHLRFEFPGTWYAYENNAMLAYHPRRLTLNKSQLESASKGLPDASVPELVAKFVLLGLPQRFAPGDI
jgi:SAM-dependent methyltransferase